MQKKNLGDFFTLYIQNREEPHKISLSESTVLSMSFPTRVGSRGRQMVFTNFNYKNRLSHSFVIVVHMHVFLCLDTFIFLLQLLTLSAMLIPRKA